VTCVFSTNQLLLFSIVFAVIGTAAFAVMAGRMQPESLSPSEVSMQKVGRLVEVSGKPSGVSLRAGGLSFSLCSVGCVQVRASADVSMALQESGIVDKLKSGDSAAAIGVVKSSSQFPYLQVLEQNSISVLG